jgi:hypothetical protein
MYEELSVSKNPEHEKNSVRQPVKRTRGTKRLSPANTNRDETPDPRASRVNCTEIAGEQPTLEYDDDINDYDDQVYTALAKIERIECVIEPETQHNGSIFRRPERDELFTIVGEPLKISCLVLPIHDDSDQHIGEAYYPLNRMLRDQLKVPTRELALHPAISCPHKPFILPQLIERRCSEHTGRDASLVAALSMAPGNWARLWYDEDTQCFDYCHIEQEPDDAPEYPGFLWDCLHALGESFCSEPEHPLELLIQEQQRLHMRP